MVDALPRGTRSSETPNACAGALGAKRWSVLGELKFGSSCSLHSCALRRAASIFFTGGLPPVGRPVDDMYATAYDAMRVR